MCGPVPFGLRVHRVALRIPLDGDGVLWSFGYWETVDSRSPEGLPLTIDDIPLSLRHVYMDVGKRRRDSAPSLFEELP